MSNPRNLSLIPQASGEVGSSKHLFLRPTCYACETADGVVLLDLRSGKYFGVNSDSARALGSVVQGWPSTESAPASQADAGTMSTAEDLINRGLLTWDLPRRPYVSNAVPTPTRGIPHAEIIERPTSIAFHHRLTFFRAWVHCRMSLRRHTLEAIVEATRQRKAATSMSPNPEDEVLARKLAVVFYRLRPWAYTANNACLLDSFVLSEFLAQYGLFPMWVVGILTQPFEAHSWVQHGDLVLNDSPERARRYTPILAI